jgi:hypothetical protein
MGEAVGLWGDFWIWGQGFEEKKRREGERGKGKGEMIRTLLIFLVYTTETCSVPVYRGAVTAFLDGECLLVIFMVLFPCKLNFGSQNPIHIITDRHFLLLLTSDVKKSGKSTIFPSVNQVRNPPSAPLYFLLIASSVVK